ncbi:serine/threonine-protein kinase [Thermoactinospora rubra]|uniref:serine/threonine-protein kinase n=1 Tax=Thermoactinospora rubra TaxID=1088767 RepID=UPI000A105A85|nr:serine/threonine-protein kinase [Thermoactinospora rubra]
MPEELLAGRYRLDELIAQGPDCEVWRAHDRQADWTVAVKLLRAEADAVTRGRFTRRAQALAGVLHPNVVTVLDVGEHDGVPYLVMEHLAGGTLEGAGPLPAAEVRRVLGQAAAGLDALHRAGLAHGDLKARDLCRAGTGVVKLAGFGLLGDGLPPPGARALPVTPYRAPEQLEGGAASTAADLYALGCVGYELLAGRPPHTGEDLAERHRGAEPAPLGPEAPADLARLVMALLAKDPAARPSASAVRQALATGGLVETGAWAPAAGPAPRDGAAGNPPSPGDTAVYTPGPGDTAVYMPGPGDTLVDEPAHDRPDRRMIVQLVVALAVIAAVTAAFVLWPRSDGRPTAAATPTPTAAEPTAAEPAATTPTPTPPPTRTPSADPAPTLTPTGDVVTLGPGRSDSSRSTPPGGWRTYLFRLEEAVGIHERIGDISPDAAKDARKSIAKAAERLQRGRPDKVVEAVQEFMDDLAKAQAKGEAPTTGPLADMQQRWNS